MCGIAGIYGTEKMVDSNAIIAAMTDSMNHRGPDAEGHFTDENLVLGHRRLSIIDLNEKSNQPFHSNNGRYTLVFNGEIYNYRELKESLTDYSFTTDSDTEVFVAAFEKWGTKAFQLFNGMFAAAIWDRLDRNLYLVRDRVGIKPLYYYQSETSIFFASELRSLLASGMVPRKLNISSLPEYFQYQCVHAPRTMVRDVRQLEAGSYLKIGDNTMAKVEYWKPWQNKHDDRDMIVIQKNIRERLTKAVERRLIADVPVGAFLSGGIDSSLIVGIVAERLNKKLDTFNVAFDDSEFSEAQYANLVAKRFGSNHHEILLNPLDFLASLPSALKSMDHPSGDGPNSWIVSRETKNQGITVALSGLGGDEVFAGYDVFSQIPKISERGWLLSFPKFLRSLMGTGLLAKSPGMKSAKTKEVLISDYFDLEHLYPIFRKVLLDNQIKNLLPNAMYGNSVQGIIHDLDQYVEFQRLPVLSRIGIAEMSTYMQNVLLRDTDQMSMAHSLEVRVPFLDHELIEYAMHIPDYVKFPHSPKKLLVESFKDLIPTEVSDRKKMGFVLPWEKWMRADLKQFCEERLTIVKAMPNMNEKYLDQMWEAFLKEDPMFTWSRIWPIVVLGDWIIENEIEA